MPEQWEAEGTIPKTLWHDIAELGFGGLNVPEDLGGGAGLSRLDTAARFRGFVLSGACASVAAFLSIHNMCARMIATHGSDALKSAYSAQMCSDHGDHICPIA